LDSDPLEKWGDWAIKGTGVDGSAYRDKEKIPSPVYHCIN
jgi:hypothetical protein